MQLDLETEGFTYEKWGGKQSCVRGDWLVDNDGDTYTIAQDTFARTYETVGPGIYRKSAPVWAEIAERSGTVKTTEGTTDYEPGDYLVSNYEDGRDSYAVAADKFERMYAIIPE